MARPVAPGSGAFIALIAAMMTMTAMTIDINLPAIPVTAAELGASLTTAQLTVTIFFGGFAVGQLVWGPLSDRIGRKPGMLDRHRGLRARHASAARWRRTSTTLLALRAVQGFGAGAARCSAGPSSATCSTGRRWRGCCPWRMAAFITAPIVAPTIGALILSFASWRWIFGFLAIYGSSCWPWRRCSSRRA